MCIDMYNIIHVHALETHSVDSYEDSQQRDPYTKRVHNYIALFPGSLRGGGGGTESLGTFTRKAVNFWHIIIHAINVGCSHFSNNSLVI